MNDSIVIIGGFDREELLPVLIEGFEDAGCDVFYLPSRGVIEQHRKRDADFAGKEIIPFPRETPCQCQTEVDFNARVRAVVADCKPRLVMWWYAKDDRPAGLVESLGCPTVRFSWDDPLSIMWGEDYSRGFTHAVTGCRTSIAHYAKRGVKAMWTLPPVSPTIHGQAQPIEYEQCDIGLTFYALYGGKAAWLTERCKRRELIVASAGLGRAHVYGGWGRDAFPDMPRTSFRGFRATDEMPRIFASSKITVTHHPQIEAVGYVSPRDTAAMASGSFLLSDDCAGIVECLPEVTTYCCLGDFRVLAERYLEEEQDRRDAVGLCRTRVLSEYSGERFSRKLLEFVG